MEHDFDPAWDTPIRGMKNIARAAGFIRDDGTPDLKAAYHAFKKGRLPASKEGTAKSAPIVTTRRRLTRVARGEAASS
jgi:hypothetical protein